MNQLFALGLVVSGVNYLATAGYFFSNDQTGLGVLLLLIPPAELVLPWLASPILGIASLVGLGCMVLGAAKSE